jgi:outer membrane protein assembly factor BamB
MEVRFVPALLLALVLAVTPLLGAPAEWIQFRLNNNANAVIPGTLAVHWTRRFRGGFSSSPTLAGGTLFVASNRGELAALDPSTGHVRWLFHAFNSLMTAPIVYRGLVIAGEGDATPMLGTSAHPVRVGGGACELIAVDARTGVLRWRRPLPGTAMPTPAIVGGVLVQHSGGGFLSAFDPRDGRPLYQINLGSIASMSAILPVGGGSYITSGALTNAIWKLHAQTPSVIWKHLFDPRDSGMGDCPAASANGLLFCNYLRSRKPADKNLTGDPVRMHAFAIDLQTGALAWDVPLESGTLKPRNEAAIPLATPQTVYEGSSIRPYMHALDARSGRLRWRVTTRGPVKGGSVLSSGVLYFGDRGGYIYAVDAGTGRVRGVRHFATQFNVGSPILAGRTLIVGGLNGLLVAFPIDAFKRRNDAAVR